MNSFSVSTSILAVSMLLALAPAAAQQPSPQYAAITPQQRSAASALDLPEITVMGAYDPNVRKATAIVNGDIITDTDVDQRLGLVLIANQGQIPANEREMLRLQILRNLIDEKLQIQEAARKDVVISDAEVDQVYARVSTQNNQSPEEFERLLRAGNSSPASIRQQIRAELAWSRLLRSRVEPFVNVGDEEVQSVINRLEASKGQEEYRVGEIFLSAPPELQLQVQQEARRIVEQVRAGASFVAYARQFSEASTAAVGGDLGWVRAEQLSPALQPVVTSLERGAVSDPVLVPGGVAIIALVDTRQVLASDPGDALLSLKQLTIPLPADITEQAARKLATDIQAQTQNMGGCGGADAVAKKLGASVVTNDQLRLGDLPAPLQQMMQTMPVGGSTPAFGSAAEGLRVLVLCGRDDPPAGGNLPSFDDVYSQITDQRVNSAARRYLRDLRRDAVVDYR
ncbi:MAG: peptidylprolyl isomerase [Sphingomonadaceae bacterium]